MQQQYLVSKNAHIHYKSPLKYTKKNYIFQQNITRKHSNEKCPNYNTKILVQNCRLLFLLWKHRGVKLSTVSFHQNPQLKNKQLEDYIKKYLSEATEDQNYKVQINFVSFSVKMYQYAKFHKYVIYVAFIFSKKLKKLLSKDLNVNIFVFFIFLNLYFLT